MQALALHYANVIFKLLGIHFMLSINGSLD